MATRAYPRNLYAELQRRWTAPPLDRWPRLDLPGKRVFDELLGACYHASFMTEEVRPIVFRVALIAAAAPVSPHREEPVPPEPITRYKLWRRQADGLVNSLGLALTVSLLERAPKAGSFRQFIDFAQEAVGVGSQAARSRKS